MIKKALLVSFGCGLLSLPILAQQLKPHTEFRIKLTGPLSTQANRKGDKLAAQVISPKAFAGATLEGELTECNGKGLFHRSSVLKFTFKKLHTKSGMVPIVSDVKLFSNSKGKSNVDDQGSGVERTSEKLAAAETVAKSTDAKVSNATTKTAVDVSTAASEIIVQMSSKEKHISFAPGSEFVLDVSRSGDAPAEKSTTKPR
jgi:hypothetical protein